MSIQWRTALCFCRLLSKRTGKKFRLPTEAEWEYACRGGSDKPAPEPLGDHAWYKDNAGNRNQEVGRKRPNAFSLYVMLGNVWELCLELYQPEPGVAEAGKSPWEGHVCGLFEKCFHVIRGGSWNDPASELRAASRMWIKSEWNHRDPNRPRGISWLTDGPFVGFRVVRDLEPGEK
jgi:formylglycine-generating enzyme required for sulfatase activity